MRKALAILTAALALTACSANSGQEPAPPAVTVTDADPSPTFDTSTIAACQHAADSDAAGADMNAALEAARSARASAGSSDVDALREASEKFSGEQLRSPIDNANALSANATVSAWCISHGLGPTP
ncbi:hypothetical protein [Actinomadura sp. HBU206391]|uniref:hypothetical protein n=1 Tax=Actinomadura sp. HBU206391 TaxID=2731692 RepID=UPI00164FE068|nr:hypothetical protein [Actinomadura sp. HBU206391]MBC6458442.1 hypothetical protein [Actinomadura sp. HBU206391]